MEKPFHLDATHSIFENANALKKSMTEAESKLWEMLRNRKIMNLKFRRQHPISDYIVDFYCHELKLIIELDGEIHDLKENKVYDKDREEILTELGFTVLRFKNEMVLKQTKSVLNEIKKVTISHTPLHSQENEAGI